MNHKLLRRNDISFPERNPPLLSSPLSSQLIREMKCMHCLERKHVSYLLMWLGLGPRGSALL